MLLFHYCFLRFLNNNHISKNIISRMNKDEVFEELNKYTNEFDEEFKKYALEGVELSPECIVKTPLYWNGIFACNKYFTPHPIIICGITALIPNTSGNHRISLSTPNSSDIKRFPIKN